LKPPIRITNGDYSNQILRPIQSDFIFRGVSYINEHLSKSKNGAKMKTKNILVTTIVTLMILVTACAPQASLNAAPTVLATTMAPANTAMPAMPTATSMSGMPASVTFSTGMDKVLGSLLVDQNGMTLYMFKKDNPGTSACYGKCATTWPPLLTTGAPTAGSGADGSLLSTFKRTDGSMQVTYNGMPLYRFSKDTNPGDVMGEGVAGIWYVVSPKGVEVMAPATATPVPTATGSASLMVASNVIQGTFLVDAKGMTLYLFTNDSPNTSTCYSKCASYWPPLLSSGTPVYGNGVDVSKLGSTNRTDGTQQVTYNGWPLYYFSKDTIPGDVIGQGVTNSWYMVAPDGTKITK
jgi:predicted lipoprotein with Yx(FWY)xxD motif